VARSPLTPPHGPAAPRPSSRSTLHALSRASPLSPHATPGPHVSAPQRAHRSPPPSLTPRPPSSASTFLSSTSRPTPLLHSARTPAARGPTPPRAHARDPLASHSRSFLLLETAARARDRAIRWPRSVFPAQNSAEIAGAHRHRLAPGITASSLINPRDHPCAHPRHSTAASAPRATSVSPLLARSSAPP
jgi:hypothetical protein